MSWRVLFSEEKWSRSSSGEDGESLGGVQEEKTVVRVCYIKESIFNKKKIKEIEKKKYRAKGVMETSSVVKESH